MNTRTKSFGSPSLRSLPPGSTVCPGPTPCSRGHSTDSPSPRPTHGHHKDDFPPTRRPFVCLDCWYALRPSVFTGLISSQAEPGNSFLARQHHPRSHPSNLVLVESIATRPTSNQKIFPSRRSSQLATYPTLPAPTCSQPRPYQSKRNCPIHEGDFITEWKPADIQVLQQVCEFPPISYTQGCLTFPPVFSC